MQHIVFDLEWNQAVVREKIIQSPVFLHGEIVQIGAVKLNDAFQVIDQLKLDVRPAYYTRMNSRVRRLTGISNQMLKQGLSFPEALDQFRAWCGAEGPFDFITWGTDDMPILRENLQLYEQELDWLPPCYDLQRIYDQQVAHGNRQWALSTALEKLEITPIGQAHDALNDALNTVQICGGLDMVRGLAEYTEPPRNEKRSRRGISNMDMAVLGEILEQTQEKPSFCPLCGQAMWATNWIPRSEGKFVAVATCPEHGDFLRKLRIQAGEEGDYILTRSLRTMDAEARAQMSKPASRRRKKRRRKGKGQNATPVQSAEKQETAPAE